RCFARRCRCHHRRQFGGTTIVEIGQILAQRIGMAEMDRKIRIKHWSHRINTATTYSADLDLLSVADLLAPSSAAAFFVEPVAFGGQLLPSSVSGFVADG